MVNIESLHCPNCGAPLPVRPGQTLAACVYCNSTVRLTPGAAPTATRAVEVPPEVIDEVKRMLLTGQRLQAAEYYAKAAQVPSDAAQVAVDAIERNMAYYPPLRGWGVALLAALDLIGMAGLLMGMGLLVQSNWVLGGLLAAVAALFMAGNTLVLARGLPGFLLGLNGRPATARVLKTWLIRTDHVQGKPVELQRLLLEVQPPGGGRPYQTEANILVREARKPSFAVGKTIEIKFDPQTPHRVVVMGPGEK